MPAYTPPLADYRFVLHEALKVQDETAIGGYEELTPDFTGAVLEEAGKIASEVLAPLNQPGDRQGCWRPGSPGASRPAGRGCGRHR